MKTKQILFLIALVLAVMITVSSAFSLPPPPPSTINVISTPGDAIEGTSYSYDINVDIPNPKFEYKGALNGFVPTFIPQVNSTTGEFTWLPAAGETGKKTFWVEIQDLDNLGNTLQYQFDVQINPVLEITNLQVGKKGENLVSYNDGETTAAFKPGDEVTFKLTTKNKYTSTSHELPLKATPPVNDGTIENIYVASIVNPALSNFPSQPEDLPTPFFLNENQEQVLTFTYKIPASLTAGTYGVNFMVDGDDLVIPLPGNTYHSLKGLILKVNQDAYDVLVEKVELVNDINNDNNLTCQLEKQTKNVKVQVKLVNIGLADEDVKVTLKNQALGIDDSVNKNIKVESGNPGSQVVSFDLNEESITDLHELEIKVYKKSTFPNKLYDSDKITVQGEDCSLSFNSISPAENPVYIKDGSLKDFKVDIKNLANLLLTYKWDLDNTPVGSNSDKYTPAAPLNVGDYTIKVDINNGDLSKEWTVKVSDKPVDWQLFNGAETTDLSNITDIKNVAEFTLDNGFGKIKFSQNVDLSEILFLNDVVVVKDGLIAVDSATAPELNKPATITLKKTFTNYKIEKSANFNAGPFTECTVQDGCTFVSKSNNEFVFKVAGFSTYQVVEVQPANFEVSEILFADVERDADDVTTGFTVKNIGTTEKLTDLTIELVGVDSEYNAKFVGSLPTQLLSGQQESLTLQIDVPKDEDGGKHSIGLVKFTGKNENNEVITKEVGIYVQPKSYLLVDNIEVNGKSSGDLVMDDTNEIEFTITNDYDEDMDVSEIRVRLLDADGDEILDQEVDLEDKDMIKDGEEEDYSVELDLNGEKLSDEEYTLEITVEGEADDNTNHKTVETKTVGVDRKSHQVIISSAALTSSKLICSEYTTLHVTVENVGKNTEDDVEIRVKNSALNLDLKKTGIELEDYSSNDNDYKATFSLNVADAKAGTYTLDVELYRDGDLEETKKVELVIVGCSATESEEETVNDYSKLAAELQQKLNGYVDEKETTTVKGSFRESSTYTTLLGILVVLVFVAAVLSLALLFTKRR